MLSFVLDLDALGLQRLGVDLGEERFSGKLAEPTTIVSASADDRAAGGGCAEPLGQRVATAAGAARREADSSGCCVVSAADDLCARVSWTFLLSRFAA